MQGFNFKGQTSRPTECGFYDVANQRDAYATGTASFKVGGDAHQDFHGNTALGHSGAGARRHFGMPARPAAAPLPDTPYASARTLKNTFLPHLSENRHLFSRDQQEAIERLQQFDKFKQRGLTNGQLNGFEILQPEADQIERKLLRRKASFLLVRGLLDDVAETTKLIMETEEDDPKQLLNRGLLSAQVEGLKHQAEINLDDLCQKIARAERFCPLMTQRTAFNQFLQKNRSTLNALVDSCRQAGPSRHDGLKAGLEKLGVMYLTETNRLPKGLSRGQTFESAGITFSSGSFAVSISNETGEYADFNRTAGGTFAAIFLRPEDCTNSRYDPTTGSLDERHYARGFERCTLPQKQAAVFIQKFFNQLGDLEIRVAEFKGLESRNGTEAEIAELSRDDTGHTGSVKLGDFHDEGGISRHNQRAARVDNVLKIGRFAQLYEMANDEGLLLDPALSEWLTSPQFTKDIEGIKHPEFRAWAFNVACVKNGLLDSPVFSQ
jgi:hypothetical protein